VGPEIEAEFQFADAVDALHGSARIALDGQAGVFEGEIRTIVEHDGLGATRFS
jgi:hypothetical protein